jgi:hypothetical protein
MPQRCGASWRRLTAIGMPSFASPRLSRPFRGRMWRWIGMVSRGDSARGGTESASHCSRQHGSAAAGDCGAWLAWSVAGRRRRRGCSLVDPSACWIRRAEPGDSRESALPGLLRTASTRGSSARSGSPARPGTRGRQRSRARGRSAGVRRTGVGVHSRRWPCHLQAFGRPAAAGGRYPTQGTRRTVVRCWCQSSRSAAWLTPGATDLRREGT